jgi:hypothetical protein
VDPNRRTHRAAAVARTGISIACILTVATAASAATRTVNAGGDLQAALNAAQPGDEIVLQAGARFTGSFALPAKPDGPVIIIRSSATVPLRRVGPADASLMPTIASPTVEPALSATNTSNWRLQGIRFEANPYGEYNIISLWDVNNVTMDRLLILGGPNGQKRAIMGNGRNVTLTRSYIANIWKSGQDSQAFCAWDGAGPYTVSDNYLEAASENVLFGGANSQSADRIPSDILVEGNFFTKPLAWKGQPRVVKNLFELKSARRVTVRNNVFEHNWTDGQNGYAILFTVRNDEGGSPWSVVEDVLFERNIVRDVENGINVLGYDSYSPSGRTTRVTIRHNLIVTAGSFLQAGGEVGTLVFDHNTVDQGYNFGMLYGGAVWLAGSPAPRAAAFAVEDLTLTNTLAYHREYGLMGEDAGIGTPALTRQTRTYRWTNNVLAGATTHPYPDVTWRPTVQQHQAQFNPDYTLVATSTYRRAATDGTDLGVDWALLQQGLELQAPHNVHVKSSE